MVYNIMGEILWQHQRSLRVQYSVLWRGFWYSGYQYGIDYLSLMVSYATTSLYHNLSRHARPPARHVDLRQRYAWLVSHRTNMVRRLAAVAYKPQCSGTTPPMVKALT
jgi:hypothetical protein